MTTNQKAILRDLRAAWKLIASKKRWTQDAYARTKTGRACTARSEYAVQWCATGALDRIDASHATFELLRGVAGARVEMINDLDGYAAVRKLYAEAIKCARSVRAKQRAGL